MTRPDTTPSTVTVAVSAGVAATPLLLFYSAIFLLHGYLLPVEDPEITSTRAGEGLAGLIAVGFLVVVSVGVARLAAGRGRWLFLAGQAVVLVVDLMFLFDRTYGDRRFPTLLVLTSLIAAGFALRQPSSEWVQDRLTRWLDRRAARALPQTEIAIRVPLA